MANYLDLSLVELGNRSEDLYPPWLRNGNAKLERQSEKDTTEACVRANVRVL